MRLLVAQAIVAQLPILRTDSAFDAYPVRVFMVNNTYYVCV